MSKKAISLSELCGEYASEIEEFLSTEWHPSLFEDYEECQLLIIRQMTLEGQSLTFKSTAFIFKGKKIYKYNQDDQKFYQLTKGVDELHLNIFNLYQKNSRIITGYFNEIEQLEDQLFNRDTPPYFMDLWFAVKKDLSRVENYYFRNALVYKEFQSRMSSLLVDYKDEFKDIEESIQFQNSSIQTHKSRLDSLHHYYDSIKADKLNTTLLFLTIISGVFLPLNLIVGFFGMNTSNLFFTETPEGTMNVVYLLIGVVFVCLLGMRLLKTIDRFIFRTLFGRYDFYKKISHRIEQIDSKLRGQ